MQLLRISTPLGYSPSLRLDSFPTNIVQPSAAARRRSGVSSLSAGGRRRHPSPLNTPRLILWFFVRESLLLVCEFGRTIHSGCTMTHASITRSRLILSRMNKEGYIPVTFTACLPQSFLPLPITPPHLTSSDAPQRSEEWFALRKDKLTTSTFSTALGFWKGNRRSELWQQKVFSSDSDSLEVAAKAAMNWGVINEPAAIERYKTITGQEVSLLGFAVHAEVESGWLGTSPDGLLGEFPCGGILEVKCPYNKGRPELGLPWQAVPYYYMPQVQGQMEIMDREWVDLYCWTPSGSVLFRVFRDREYWELMHRMLKDFWWGNVVPAMEALAVGKEEEAMAYEPKARHELTGRMIWRSRKLAAEARMLCRDIAGHLEFFR